MSTPGIERYAIRAPEASGTVMSGVLLQEDVAAMAESHQAELEQLDRILQSVTFRNSEALRRLLWYLAENSLLGRADDLKEYSVGIDAFSKPASYDPRQDSSVRLQVGRLRQKLAEYYRTEGESDPLLVDLPKRHFKVVFEPRSGTAPDYEATETPEESDPTPELAPQASRPINRTSFLVTFLGAALLVSVGIASLLAVRVWQDSAKKTADESAWTTELRELWDPFINSRHPIIVAVADPLFVRMGRSFIARDAATHAWGDVPSSESLMAVKAALKADRILPFFGFAPFGDLDGSFMLARLLATRKPDISLTQSTQLSARQLGDNNFILLGSQIFFDSAFQGMPVDTLFRSDSAGIHDLRAQTGKPVVYSDQSEFSPNGLVKGTAYAVVINMPGPFGKGEVRGFIANSPSACLGAIRCFTDAGLARALVSKMADAHGAVPRYYEAVLKVSYENSMPVQISYVTHRELRAAGNLVSSR